MAIKTRLDAVTKLRDRAKDMAKTALGKARQETAKAEAALIAAKEKALRDDRASGPAANWQAAEAARARALLDLKKAEEAVRVARERETAARKAFEQAYKDAEVVRRVADARRQELIHQADRAERKMFDELAAIQFGRKLTEK